MKLSFTLIIGFLLFNLSVCAQIYSKNSVTNPKNIKFSSSNPNNIVFTSTTPYPYTIKRPKFVQKYDSINDFTHVIANDSKIAIKGKWCDFDFENYATEYYISHCPIFINEDYISLEISVEYAENGLFKRKKPDEVLANYKNHFKKNEYGYYTTIQTVKSDSVNNYCLYKVQKHSRFNPNKLTESYYLLGVKNSKLYRMALFNFDEALYEDLYTFLISLYLTN